MEEKQWRRKLTQPFRKRENQIGLLSGITIFALLCAIWNTAEMRSGLEYSTREYCEEITAQMRDAVSFGIDSKMIELVNVADSLSQSFDDSETASLEEFLSRKAGILEFDALFLIGSQGECMVQAIGEGSDLDGGKIREMFSAGEFFQDEVQMGFVEGQMLFYTAPVHMESGLPHVLVGIRSKETMQGMISSNAFEGNTLSCIVDREGGVVLSPTNLNRFMELDSIFKNDPQGEASTELRQMQEDMRNGKAGTVRFTDVTGSENLLAYNPLQINNWFLLTIVPVDLMSGNISSYLFRTVLIVLGTALVFLLLLLLIYRVYNDNQKQLTRLAFEDSVTGGMNSAAFQLKYRRLLRERRPPKAAVVLLNVRNFKLVNEKLGFGAGNEILRAIYQGIGEQLDGTRDEFAARGEMDHFFLCVSESCSEQIQARVHQMEESINRRLSITHPGNYLTFAAGCCLVEDTALDIRTIQDRARVAARDETAVAPGRCVFYNDSIAKRLQREQELDAQFADAIASRGFQVYLQPKVDLNSGRLRGAEALVRWNHPTLGVISPADFVPLFERSGKICRLDFYVFEEVCRFYKRRKAAGKPWYPVSVNLSRYHFYEEGFLDKFQAAAQACGLPENSVEFELTESMFFDRAHNERIEKSISRMHRMGFRCSMDDFGSGYSSLGILKEFDVDVLKMDRSFFLDMESEKARDIIRSVVELAAKLRLETVAEGIEKAEQIEFLRAIHCDTVQGYFFSRPLPMDEFESWVSQYEAG